MPSFGKRSKENLKLCDVRLQDILMEAIKYYDFAVICGHRGEEEQNKAFHEGRSKLKFPQSKHNQNPSKAVDVVPYPINWNDESRFFYLAGLIKGIASSMGHVIRWGGDWDGDGDFNDQSFIDLPHFELKE
jgi:hypothetical protein